LSETGKSTIVKSMKMLFKDVYDKDEDRKKYKMMIGRNILFILKGIIKKYQKRCLKMDEDVQISAARILMYHMQSDSLPKELIEDMRNVWNDFKAKAYQTGLVDFASVDNAPHFLDAIDNICSPSYIPTVADILKCRAKTTTISEVEFDVDTVHFNVVDMGGHRHERCKWKKGLEEAGAIMFCVALSDYDQYLTEDQKINRMHESLDTFHKILESFPNRIVFICFTKRALFAAKIKRVDLNVCFPDYEGGEDYNCSIEFIMQKFSDVANNSINPQKIYASIINATEPKEIHYMLKSAVKIIKKIKTPQLNKEP